MNTLITPQTITRTLLALAMLSAMADVSANLVSFDPGQHHTRTGMQDSRDRGANRNHGMDDLLVHSSWSGDGQGIFDHFNHDHWQHHHDGFFAGDGQDGDGHWNDYRHCHVPPPSVVPLPATVVLLLSGLAGLLGLARRDRQAALNH
jgi:PEP-CTERM motif